MRRCWLLTVDDRPGGVLVEEIEPVQAREVPVVVGPPAHAATDLDLRSVAFVASDLIRDALPAVWGGRQGQHHEPPALPPHSLDAEMATLGAIMLGEPLRVMDAVGELKPEHFYDERNQAIFTAMLGLVGEGEPVDPVSVASALVASSCATVDDEYIGQLLGACPSTERLGRYAEIVREMALLRRLLEETRLMMAQVGA